MGKSKKVTEEVKTEKPEVVKEVKDEILETPKKKNTSSAWGCVLCVLIVALAYLAYRIITIDKKEYQNEFNDETTAIENKQDDQNTNENVGEANNAESTVEINKQPLDTESTITLNGKNHSIKVTFNQNSECDIYFDNTLISTNQKVDYYNDSSDYSIKTIKGIDGKDYAILIISTHMYTDSNTYFILSDSAKLLVSFDFNDMHPILELTGDNVQKYYNEIDYGYDKQVYYPIAILDNEIRYFLTEKSEIIEKYHDKYYENMYEINSKEKRLTISNDQVDINETNNTYKGVAGTSGAGMIDIVKVKIY